MSATKTVTATASEASLAESRRDRMKRAAVENIHTAANKTRNAAVSAIEYCHQHREQVKKSGEALGAVGGGALGIAISSETGLFTAAVVVPVTTGAGKMLGGKTAECAVDGCHERVAPKIPGCAQTTANCSGKVAERGIDCAVDSAETCAQGTRDLTNRVSACF